MRISAIPTLLTLAAVAGCGSDSTTPGARTVSRVTVTGTNVILRVGETSPLAVAAYEASGAQIASPGPALWSSSATTVASVEQTGKVTAVGVGSSTIAASIAGVSGSVLVKVNAVVSIPRDTIFTPGLTFSPNRLTVAAGSTVIFALGFDGIGHDVRFAVKTGSPPDIPVTTRQYIARTFPIAGEFSYFCPTHPEMTGVITVQ